MEAGYFKTQIVPIELKTRKGVEQFTTDEHVRPAATKDDLSEAENGVQEGRHRHRRQQASTTPAPRSC